MMLAKLTCFTVTSTNNIDATITLEGTQLEEVAHFEYLGQPYPRMGHVLQISLNDWQLQQHHWPGCQDCGRATYHFQLSSVY